MAASKADLIRWFDRGISEGASHMIVAVDQVDWDDHPVYVDDPSGVADEVARIRADTRLIMEIYDLSMSKDAQMAERRAWHPPVAA